MTTVCSKCVKIVAFEGGGDDMDWPIKETLLLNNKDSGAKRNFCGINSYNIGRRRPLMQMVHFIWIYFRVAKQLGVDPGDKDCMIDVIIPTGAMGNITGAYMAKQMGVPIGRLCASVNINDIAHRAIEKGEFHRKKIQKTLSDAINIEVPYNFEQIVFYVTGGNHALIKEWMTIMEQTQQLTLEGTWLATLKQDFCSARVTDNEMCNALREVYASLTNVADPHTAVAMAAAAKLGYSITEKSSLDEKSSLPLVIVATASPCKFEDTLTVALGQDGWKQWERHSFPARARNMLQLVENTPILYRRDEGASLIEVQSKWREMMVGIVRRKHWSEMK